jgi:hypothetical protein
METAGFRALVDDVVVGDMVDAAVAAGHRNDREKGEKGEGQYEWVVWDDDSDSDGVGEEGAKEGDGEEKENGVKAIEDVVNGVLGR